MLDILKAGMLEVNNLMEVTVVILSLSKVNFMHSLELAVRKQDKLVLILGSLS
jgi:hypothetical protein